MNKNNPQDIKEKKDCCEYGRGDYELKPGGSIQTCQECMDSFKMKNSLPSQQIEQSLERILTALRYKGIDVKRPDYIVDTELPISTSDSPDGLQTEGIGANITWGAFLKQEPEAVAESARKEAKIGIEKLRLPKDFTATKEEINSYNEAIDDILAELAKPKGEDK